MEDPVTQEDEQAEQPIEGFDAVAWTRARRDALYRKYQEASPEEFVQKLVDEGRSTTLWKELTRRHGCVDESA